MDITELILSDHHEQRRMFALLDDVDREDTETLAAVWRRLCILLEVHAAAEEELFYPRLLDVGSGAGDADSADEETKDAIGDHNDIRAGIAHAAEHAVGSTGGGTVSSRRGRRTATTWARRSGRPWPTSARRRI